VTWVSMLKLSQACEDKLSSGVKRAVAGQLPSLVCIFYKGGLVEVQNHSGHEISTSLIAELEKAATSATFRNPSPVWQLPMEESFYFSNFILETFWSLPQVRSRSCAICSISKIAISSTRTSAGKPPSGKMFPLKG